MVIEIFSKFKFLLFLPLLFPVSSAQGHSSSGKGKCHLKDQSSTCHQPALCNGSTKQLPFICCQSNSQPCKPSSDKPLAMRNAAPSHSSAVPDISPPRFNFECGKSVPIGRPVVGGVTANLASWPWMALLGNTSRNGTLVWFCGGVLINEQWVLTAAHCPEERRISKVRLGEHNYTDPNDGAPHQDFEVETIIRHPDFTIPQVYHDLALIKLRQKVKIDNFIRPVCLPWGEESKRNMVGQKVTLTGWGHKTFDGTGCVVLQQVEVTVFPSKECDQKYKNIRGYSNKWPQGIGEESVCAGDIKGGKDACQGDSGGPIVSRNSQNRYVLAGIVSLGYGCGSVNYPGLYVNARGPLYLSWIKRTAF